MGGPAHGGTNNLVPLDSHYRVILFTGGENFGKVIDRFYLVVAQRLPESQNAFNILRMKIPHRPCRHISTAPLR